MQLECLRPAAAKTFFQLVDGLRPGEARRVDNAPGTFTAVSVDRLDRHLFSIAHLVEVNGDLVADPDVEFLVLDGKAFPTAIDHGLVGHYSRCVAVAEDGSPTLVRPSGQLAVARFCGMWMRNIRWQQGL